MRWSQVSGWLFLVGMLFQPTKMVAQDVTVLVIDALDGKPQASVRVDYFCTGLQHNSALKWTRTNSAGFAKIANLCSDEEKIEISALPKKKEQCGTLEPQAVQNILSVGVVAEPGSDGNIWCPAKVSKRLKAVPGQVTLFVKKPTWWQAHVAG
jgi:hypothetical protein